MSAKKHKEWEVTVQNEETNGWLAPTFKEPHCCEFLKVGWEGEETYLYAFTTKDPGIIEFYHEEGLIWQLQLIGTYNLKTKEYKENPKYKHNKWWYSVIQQHIAYLEAVIKGAQ